MFSTPLGKTLKKLRLQNRKTQKQFAAEFGLTQRRWSKFECGDARPNDQELELIHARFGDLPGTVNPYRALRQFVDNAKGHRPPAGLYLPPCDRTSQIRYYAARQQYNEFVDRLSQEIRRRVDFRYCQALCDLLSLGSADEVLLVLYLLQQGGLPGSLVLNSLGTLPHSAVDPATREDVSHRPFPCISFPNDFYFFQVSLATPRIFTVDVLRWNGSWSIIEVDGRGHDFRGDQARSLQLGLPERRLTPKEIMADGFQLWELRRVA